MTCLTCYSSFVKHKKTQKYCSRACTKTAMRKKFPTKYGEKERSAYLQKAHGISLEEYNKLLQVQGGVCKICRERPKKDSLAVDHDHQTGFIRGLLCYNCNDGLGRFKDNPERLRLAADYLYFSEYIRQHFDKSPEEIKETFKRILNELPIDKHTHYMV